MGSGTNCLGELRYNL